MRKAMMAGGAFAAVLGVLAVVFGYRAFERYAGRTTPAPPATAAPAELAVEAHPSFLYGRITTLGGDTYEGRLRWGGDQEAFWGDYCNGSKRGNPWAAHVPADRLPKQRDTIEIFGVEIASRETPVDLGRLFMARFGDISSIEAEGRDVRVTLKSGTVFNLDRFSAGDFDDGVRVWDGRRGTADLDSLEIRGIELLAAARSGPAPHRLHGTVRTRQGGFTGFIQWNRKEGAGSDELDGRAGGGDVSLRFDAIRSIARRPGGSLVTLADGREMALSGTGEAGQGNLGIYVDDRRYGRVLISWESFERVDFSPSGGSGPAYGDFPPGTPLQGSVTTRGGRRLAGRLVYDLDESETTETLDAPAQGVDYTIPFGLVASIVRSGEARGSRHARVALHNGEELQLEFAGDLGGGNAGMLIFAGGRRPEYVAWDEVQRVDFDRPEAMYPPIGGSGDGRAGRAAGRGR